MNTPTLYLDWMVLAAAAYPSGLSYSLFVSWKGAPRGISTGLLATLALPYLVVVAMVFILRPQLFAFHGARWPLIVAAILLAPIALLLEYGINAIFAYRKTGVFPRKIALQGFWRNQLRPTDHILLWAIAIGEEFFYRALWIGILLGFGVPTAVALIISSVIYGMNHMAFGGTSVFTKTVSGLLYGGIYLFGGQSILLPILTHVLQNTALFALGKESHA